MVDDDEIVAQLVQDAFMAAGHPVGWLDNGATALDVIKRRPPDLVILDCNMPGLSGVQLLRFLREEPSLHSLPILMLTGRQSESDERIVRYEGANDYMRKPFDAVRLVGRAEALMKGDVVWS